MSNQQPYSQGPEDPYNPQPSQPENPYNPPIPSIPPTPPPPQSYQNPPSGFEEPRRERHDSRPWIGGLVLVVLGLVFLLRNVGVYDLHNWWALFILIPAFGSFATAWSIYQNNGMRMSAAVRGPVIGGLILTLVTAAFLLDLNWGLIWPAFLIIIGLGALITAFQPQ